MKYEGLVTYLKKEGIPNEEIANLVRTHMISESANAQFFVGDNDMSKNIAAGVAGGNKPYTKTRK